jgi:hypothetical protein
MSKKTIALVSKPKKARSSVWSMILQNGQTVDLPAGHVWITAKLFSNSAGNDEYVGFEIKKGSFTLSNTFQWNGEFLEFEGGIIGELTIEMVQPVENAPAVEGCSAAQDINFQYPHKITLEWKDGALKSISGYGNKLTLSNYTTAVEYHSNHIFVPCKSVPDK